MFVVLLAAMLTTAWHSPLARRQVAGLYAAQAQHQLERKEIDAARGNYRRAVQLSPEIAAPRLELARLELAEQRPEHAYLELQTLTELHPELTAAWLELAQLMLDRGLLEEPEQALGRALEAMPTSPEALQLRAIARQRLNRHYSAWIDLRQRQSLLPANAENEALKQRLDQAGANLGTLPALLQTLLPPSPDPAPEAHAVPADEDRFDGGLPRERWPGALATLRQQLQAAFKKQDLAAAQKIADHARTLYPGTIYGPWLAGIVHLAQNQSATAEANLREALVLAPRSRLVLTGLTKIWVQTKGAAYAGEQLTALAERDPGYGFARHMAAVAYLKGRQPAKAETVLRQGIEQLPVSPVPYRELTRFYLELDRAGDAATICKQGLVASPRDPPLLALRARVAVALKDDAAAISAYEQHLAVAPDSQDSRAQLARLLMTTRDDDASRQRAQQLVATLDIDAPTSPTVQDAAGVVVLKAGQTQRALEWLAVAAVNAPEDPAIQYHLASAHAQNRSPELARKALRLALDSEKPFAERLEAQRLLRTLDGSTSVR